MSAVALDAPRQFIRVDLLTVPVSIVLIAGAKEVAVSLLIMVIEEGVQK